MKIEKATLIYFSPTLSTKKILNAIVKGMNIEIKNEINLTIKSNRDKFEYNNKTDLLIIGVPVYGARIPKDLYPYLKAICGNKTPVALVTVFGNVSKGFALNELYTLVSKRGFEVIAMGAFIGRHSFATEKAPLAFDRPNIKDLQTAQNFGENIIQKIRFIDTIEKKDIIHQCISSKIVGNFFNTFHTILPQNSNKTVIKEPIIDYDKCTKCKICVNGCPKQAINTDTLKIEMDLCIGCFRCVRFCPEGARKIVYKGDKFVRAFFNKENIMQKKAEILI